MEHLSNQLRAALGAPVVSGYYLSLAELLRREASATQRAEALAAASYPPGAARQSSVTYHGRAILWHEEFAAGLGLYLADTPLYRLAALLPTELVEMNGGKALDYYDFAYLADVLRELLAHNPTANEALNISRALAWVEWEGDKVAD